MSSSRRSAGLGLVALSLLVPLTACDGGGAPPPSPPSTTAPTTTEPAQLTFAAFGPPEEIAAFGSVVAEFNALRQDAEVDLLPLADEDEMASRLRAGQLPDVFMISREDLAGLLERNVTQPLDVLLDERGVDFGDQYSRDGLLAFSAEDRLQCMPYGISPTVLFYNTDLVDFERMARRGLDVPEESTGDERSQAQSWSFEEFTAAAEYAAKPRRKTRGVHVPPTLEGLAPFVYAGGGALFDDEQDPTSLAFSDDTTRGALETVLPLLRSPLVTPTEQQLLERTPLQLFKRGRLAMIQGDRSLVPQLRQVQGLAFDVIAMPSIEQSATVGDATGVCLSRRAASTPAGADFIRHLISSEQVNRVTRAGYLVPANLEVALGDAFLQPGRQPTHAGTFNTTVRNLVFPPLLTDWAALEAVVADDLRRLLTQPVLDDLDALTEQIDEQSRTVLDPEGASPSATPTQ